MDVATADRPLGERKCGVGVAGALRVLLNSPVESIWGFEIIT